MKTIDIGSAVKPLAEYARDPEGESIIVTADDQPVAILVFVESLDREISTLQESPEFLEIIDRARAEIAQGRTISLDQMKLALDAA